MGQNDVQAIQRATDELKQATQAMAQHVQGRQTASAGAGRTGNGHDGQGGEAADDVIDAEFEVKK